MGEKRRQNGEGSVFQVSENKWVAKIYLGTGLDGKWQTKQFSGKTEAIVKKKLRDYKKSAEYLEGHMPSQNTVKEYFAVWLREYQFNKLKPSSYDRLESTVKNHVTPNIGHMKMDRVTRDNVQALINMLYKDKGLSYSSIKKVYVALKSCYDHAIMADVVLKNPCMGIELPSPIGNTKQVIPFTPDETVRLQNEALSQDGKGRMLHIYGQAFILILNTGLRMGEALSLQWSDVDFERMTITVNKNHILTKKRDRNGNALGGYDLQMQSTTKTISGRRVIPINRSAGEALTALKKDNNTEYVIVNTKKKPVLPSNFERAFHSVLNGANIKGEYGVHALRHTFASMLFAKGIDIKIVSKLLGHSTVKITYDLYVHLFESSLTAVTDVLDEDYRAIS